ncbi:MAG: UDP-4-amino-4,6-dideoxy-N-acetyl-beta-L-altrosamine transaminase [Bradyrhizobium sp.]|uniref:UDP-4-amino-4, 6-dideoxy-N-acetyl-beta-L-altrosamine transaminase n=1 Tax=Bradyrhizobium sp. TaxID=376 RepID=UPI001C28AED1|nr:UDP-4-amino-4,6-dideoxy-N-acetyl-beta-L-altrosamine transaminase [Bradyrhizobium sp.]MBU6463653.1 UDP-4-amino-4,6-dideoxy-N-acetyl-beta-L-altrosamine transaminase [Pseudomonadota bacterium]MDE2066380.1 UDP-4-amino-4,6-dideoxy-N-acetyl-beta-L-altrosamine transaminase [Bradyrhizobium sp.]MDE2470568.1 UDP-4-amino-4,6-dideoxy-N-acetyl-beta-L-altrosamine transaminase [Bradyrhizobium sp.]
MIPYGRQDISPEDIDAVTEVLRSDWLTQGRAGPQFETAMAAYCGAKNAVTVANATAALHIACLALDLGPGDYLWTTPNTFVASANCALYCGANVDFVDIDPRTYNISVTALAEKLERAELQGRLPKVVVPVHFAGQSSEMKDIRALADRYGFRIIEDASHAVGGEYCSRKIGACEYGDIAIFSFHPVKIITTGEGGMALTNDLRLAERLAYLRTHGIVRRARWIDEDGTPRQNEERYGPWYYEQIELGLNYRMTDIQAALGNSQLARLDPFVARRRELAARYDKLLARLPVTCPWQHPDTNSAWHLYVLRLNRNDIKFSRRQVFDALRAAGIGVNVHYIPVHIQPYYRRLGFEIGMFPDAESYYEDAITLPLFARMTNQEQDTVVAALEKILA